MSLRVVDVPGRVPYREGLAAQRRLARDRIEGRAADDLLLLLEHDPVLTLGRGAREENVAAPAGLLRKRGVDVVEIERGGDVTYHGPGQLVGYPILDLRRWRKDLHWYVRRLEDALILGLAELGLPAFRVGGHTGVWVGRGDGSEEGAARPEDAAVGSVDAAVGPVDAPSGPADVPEEEAPAAIAAGSVRKVASIGVHVSRWVTWHGFALNVTAAPLENFGLIVPCGIRNVRMTSLASEGVNASARAVRAAVSGGFARAFGVETEVWTGEEARAVLGTSVAARAAGT